MTSNKISDRHGMSLSSWLKLKTIPVHSNSLFPPEVAMYPHARYKVVTSKLRRTTNDETGDLLDLCLFALAKR